ncbi:cytidylate kinase-like family protein [Desulfogranum japonicum]|uniref:cytidylate kinase-like family protein n=1 Tax=Desulfogranum japonicum TaxID=231447 RepID=UPI00040B13B4|nr:cytidylate kinase-like family protein [Desulfogranum japonicum]
MAIITISRGSYSRGKEVAEKLAKKLGYECISREILLEASEEFNIPEIRLSKAIHDAASILDRLQQGKLRYMSYYRYALLKHVKNDNIVYHGLAGQFFLRDIPNVFKVRIIANMDERVEEVMRREKLNYKKAMHQITKDDEERRKWGLQLYGIDTWDSRLYDMVLNINHLSVEDAVELLEFTVQKPVFQTTEHAKTIINDLTLAAKIHSLLVSYSLVVEVKVQKGIAYLSNTGDVLRTDSIIRSRIEERIMELNGIEEVRFLDTLKGVGEHVNPFHNI